MYPTSYYVHVQLNVIHFNYEGTSIKIIEWKILIRTEYYNNNIIIFYSE